MAQDLEDLALFTRQEHHFITDEHLHELVTLDFRGLARDLGTWVEAAYYMDSRERVNPG